MKSEEVAKGRPKGREHWTEVETLNLPPSVCIYVCTEPVHMRKQHDGLAGVTTSLLGADPLSGELTMSVYSRRYKLGRPPIPFAQPAPIAPISHKHRFHRVRAQEKPLLFARPHGIRRLTSYKGRGLE